MPLALGPGRRKEALKDIASQETCPPLIERKALTGGKALVFYVTRRVLTS